MLRPKLEWEGFSPHVTLVEFVERSIEAIYEAEFDGAEISFTVTKASALRFEGIMTVQYEGCGFSVSAIDKNPLVVFHRLNAKMLTKLNGSSKAA